MHYEGHIIRPPSEANSIIFQVAVGCPHNRCTFCGAYRDVSFRIKEDTEIGRDIAFAQKYCRRQNRAFCADGDALMIPFRRLESIFQRIRIGLPWVNRISLYASGKSIRSKTAADLARLKQLGLDRVYLGVESGDDALLAAVRKGETARSLLQAGQRIIDAGLFLSTTVVLGLAGRQGSAEHIRATAALLSSMNPNQIAALSLMPLDNTPLGKQVATGSFDLLSSTEVMTELHDLVAGLAVKRTMFMANHASNYLPVSGRLPRDRKRLLKLLERGMQGRAKLVSEDCRAL